MSERIRNRILAARDIGGDVLPGDFVRLIGGSRVGMVESIQGDTALCLDLGGREVRREIVELRFLVRVFGP
jgi:hypothetical protein